MTGQNLVPANQRFAVFARENCEPLVRSCRGISVTPALLASVSFAPVSEATTIPVQVENATYTVTIRRGLLQQAGSALRELSTSSRAAIVTDENVAPHYLQPLTDALAACGFATQSVVLPSGESHKTLASIERIYDALLAARVERDTPLLSLGGGVIGDMAGFAAATILRGVPFVQIPTTLLAMVDASVGGKTGVDHAAGKNLIGAFWQPMAVLIDPAVLDTLPDREFRNGLAECVKHEVIRDAEGFANLERSLDSILARDPAALEELIAHNVRIKAAVVASDPHERGERAHLNFGHTLGHAIERVSDFAYGHGESVSLGMVAASRLAVALGMFDEADAGRIERLLTRIGLPTGGMKLDIDAILASTAGDKKVQAGKVRFVLPDRLGHVVVRSDVPPDRVRAAVESLR